MCFERRKLLQDRREGDTELRKLVRRIVEVLMLSWNKSFRQKGRKMYFFNDGRRYAEMEDAEVERLWRNGGGSRHSILLEDIDRFSIGVVRTVPLERVR